MFKSTTILAIGLAVASAQFLDVERFLQTSNTTSVSATPMTGTCNRASTTEPCTIANTCCIAITKNGVANTTGICAPVSLAFQTFTNVNSTNYTFSNCSVAATFNAWNATNTAACDTTTCNSSTSCCATKVTTINGVARATTTTECLTKDWSGLIWKWYSYAATTQFTMAVDVKTVPTCPSTGGNGGTDGTGSFGVYIKASAMMVVALIAAAFF